VSSSSGRECDFERGIVFDESLFIVEIAGDSLRAGRSVFLCEFGTAWVLFRAA